MRDLQKLLKYFNGTAIVVFFKIELSLSALVLSNSLAIYMNGLKSLVLAISALRLVASSLE